MKLKMEVKKRLEEASLEWIYGALLVTCLTWRESLTDLLSHSRQFESASTIRFVGMSIINACKQAKKT